MAGSFSSHLVDAFLSAQQATRAPFGQSPSTPGIATHGLVSFAPQMHGSPNLSSAYQEPFFMELSEESAKKIASLQAKLNRKLGPEYISQRPGPGGGPKLTYAEGWKIINLANEVFGFNGWSSSVVNLTTDFIDYNEESKRFSVGVTAIVKITLRDGVFHEDIGYGLLENSKSKGAALDKCKKEAVTDAVKRALRNFGNLLGNCLYDKAYTQEVVKIKVPPPKFEKNDLHRRPEFDESRSDASITTPIKPPVFETKPKVEPSTRMQNILNAKNETIQGSSAVPRHVHLSSDPHSAAVSTSNTRGKPPISSDSVETNTRVHATTGPPNGLRTTNPQGSSKQGLNHQRNPDSGSSAAQGDKKVSFIQPPAAGTSASATLGQGAPSRPHVVAQTAPDDLPDDDESYHFPSEDDAFFAALNLAEEEMGRAIDFDEGTGTTASKLGDKADEKAPRQQQQVQPAAQPPPPAPLAAQQHPRPPPAHSGVHGTAHITPEPQASTSTSNQSVASRSAYAVPTSLGGNNMGRPGMSSSGGFHFPPGMNPQTLGSSGPPPPPVSRPQTQAHAQAPSGVIGLKRSADVMQGHSTAQRRPAQGMGLAPHSSGGNWSGQQAQGPTRREPLTSLELGESGSVKRMRR